MNVDVLWQNFLNQIKDELSSLAYTTWFVDTKLYKLENGKATIIVPMQIHKKHMEDNYLDQIKDILNRITGTNFEIEFLLEEEVKEIEKEKSTEKVESLPTGVPHLSKEQSNLNSKYTFDNFIVGNSNKFAQAAALSVAENPGKMYNPLFLYGNSGLGKTHLMHAIGNYIVENSNRRVLYVTSDEFINDFIGINKRDHNGTNFNHVDFFKNKYRNIDVLIIDDIQFLGGATQTQQEFFHTFNTLYSDSKQIIISSDRSPDDLKFLEDRLRTRFCWGLQVDIAPPEFELKVAIIRKKLNGEKLKINDDVINFIASNVGNDVRQLEGSITRLIAYSVIMGVNNPTLEFAMEALKEFTKKTSGTDQNNIRRIQKSVANFYKISYEDIKSNKRPPNIAIPRQVAMYLCRKLTNESFERIGIEFGGKNHATVMHSCNKIETSLKSNMELKEAIIHIEQELK